jgi:hypothetical protein
MMLPNEFPQGAPIPQDVAQNLESAKVTREFYHELEHRQAFDGYCQWYYQTAERHRQELTKMRGDINIMGWFNRKK